MLKFIYEIVFVVLHTKDILMDITMYPHGGSVMIILATNIYLDILINNRKKTCLQYTVSKTSLGII